MNSINLFNISLESLNIFSFMLGMFAASVMWHRRAFLYVGIYFIGLALYYAGKVYLLQHPELLPT
jgi:hypothetical protein